MPAPLSDEAEAIAGMLVGEVLKLDCRWTHYDGDHLSCGAWTLINKAAARNEFRLHSFHADLETILVVRSR